MRYSTSGPDPAPLSLFSICCWAEVKPPLRPPGPWVRTRGHRPWLGSEWEPRPAQTHPAVQGNRGWGTKNAAYGTVSTNTERLGQPPPPSSAFRAAAGAGDGAGAPPCPDGETGWQSPGVALPGPSDKKPALLPEIQPSFVNRLFPLLLARDWPHSRSQGRAVSEAGCIMQYRPSTQRLASVLQSRAESSATRRLRRNPAERCKLCLAALGCSPCSGPTGRPEEQGTGG